MMDFEAFLIEILTLQNRRMDGELAVWHGQATEPLPPAEEARYWELRDYLLALRDQLRNVA